MSLPMTLDLRRVQVWSGDISDRPGAAAAKIQAVTRAGAELEFVFARPNPNKPEFGILFLAPISGDEQMQAAREAGLGPALDVFMLRVQSLHRSGLGSEIMSKLAIAGINLRGISMSTAEPRFSAYLAFDRLDDLTHAVQVLATIDG
jgi:hypothetical protein